MAEAPHGNQSIDQKLDRLGQSTFRARFRIGRKERLIVRERGLSTVSRHAHDLLQNRLAPAQPANDGSQTPMRGHPVFVAQHATATCCRSCLAKWHGVPKGRAMTGEELAAAVAVVRAWIEREMAQADGEDEGPVQGWLFD